ncbi:MAG: hypothetical protein AABX03_04200 [Nanoarchaeota archaeon]
MAKDKITKDKMAKKSSSSKGIMWECGCGFTEYFKNLPEECPECGELGKFIKVPKAIAQEMEEKMMEEEDY